MTILQEIGRDQHAGHETEKIVKEAQYFYDSAMRCEQRGEPVKALLHRNIAYKIQHGTT